MTVQIPLSYVLDALAGCLNAVGHVVAKEMNMPLKWAFYRARRKFRACQVDG